MGNDKGNSLSLPESGRGTNSEDIDVLRERNRSEEARSRQLVEFRQGIVDRLVSNLFFAFVIASGITVAGIVVVTRDGITMPEKIDFWKAIGPLLGAYLGYAIGSGAKQPPAKGK